MTGPSFEPVRPGVGQRCWSTSLARTLSITRSPSTVWTALNGTKRPSPFGRSRWKSVPWTDLTVPTVVAVRPDDVHRLADLPAVAVLGRAGPGTGAGLARTGARADAGRAGDADAVGRDAALAEAATVAGEGAAVDHRLGVEGVVAGALAHPKLVLDVADARDVLDKLLGEAADPAAVRHAAQHDGGVGDLDVHLAGVDVAVAGQQLADFLTDAIVRAPVAARAAPTEATLAAGLPTVLLASLPGVLLAVLVPELLGRSIAVAVLLPAAGRAAGARRATVAAGAGVAHAGVAAVPGADVALVVRAGRWAVGRLLVALLPAARSNWPPRSASPWPPQPPWPSRSNGWPLKRRPWP